MKKWYNLWLTLAMLIVGFLACRGVAGQEPDLPVKGVHLEPDGPYVLHEDVGKIRLIQVNSRGRLTDSVFDLSENIVFPVISDSGEQLFQVKLHPFQRPHWQLPQAEKMVVISDPHGNLECFVSVLQHNGIINDRYEWTFGKNQLVIIGDVFDRGKDVLPIFWLIYKLEEEAAEAGGQLLFTLGNHEEMVLRGDTRYTKKKYRVLADSLQMPYQKLWQEDSELGRWLRTRNLIQQVGDNLIVHAGLSREFLKRKESVVQMNETIGKNLSLSREERKEASDISAFVFDTKLGPFWYRGMVRSDTKYFPLTLAEVESILKKFNVRRVLVGHTVFDDVTPFFDRKVIAVNVDNQENMKEARGRGILIENGKIYVIYDASVPGLLE